MTSKNHVFGARSKYCPRLQVFERPACGPHDAAVMFSAGRRIAAVRPVRCATNHHPDRRSTTALPAALVTNVERILQCALLRGAGGGGGRVIDGTDLIFVHGDDGSAGGVVDGGIACSGLLRQ